MGTHHHTTVMEGTKIKTVTFLLAAFSSPTYGQNKASPGNDCWYTKKCQTGQSDGLIRTEPIDTNTATTFDDQVMECYDACGLEPSCTDFTLNTFRGNPTCYLLNTCTDNTDDICLEQGTCKSGPADCTSEPEKKDCPAIASANTPTGNIHWQCTDGDGSPFNGYTATAIKAESTCVLRCESWELKSGGEGYLKSTCQSNGEWSDTVASDFDDTADAELAFPSFPDGQSAYPTPAETQAFLCGCKSLPVQWPVEDPDDSVDGDQWWYDPNTEEGTDFVCDKPIEWKNGEYIIETDNKCLLFCDSHLVADVRCLNGEWTGQPELGFWCYQFPEKDDKITPAPPPLAPIL